MGCASAKPIGHQGPKEPMTKLYFVLGRSGAGKGTVLKRFVEQHPDYVHISMGDVLRAEIEKGGAFADKI